MTHRIVECAERAISLLREKRTLNILLFPELLGEASVVTYQALGWLACEGKICYSMKGRQCYVSIGKDANPAEAR